MSLLSFSPAQDWLQLWHIAHQSSRSISQLLSVFASPAAALKASPDRWRELDIVTAQIQRFSQWQSGVNSALTQEIDQKISADLHWCSHEGQGLIAIDHADYPSLLKEIADPPPLLFWKGDFTLLNLPQIGIVGTRHPSLTGKNDATAFAQELSQCGLVITSGLARGIDAAAHEGALKNKGKTIAVLGTGVDQVYPRENKILFSRIVNEGGLLLSEFCPGTPPLAQHFPRRNRIISGLSVGTLVIEAAPDSGSLITAKLAAEQGRLVWALPGSRHHLPARGCLQLIREGASLVVDATQILSDLPAMTGWLREQCHLSPSIKERPLPSHLSTTAKHLLEVLGSDCRHADWLIDITGQPASQVLRELMLLEVSGLIATVPGGYERIQ
jgi:DNA processing protein